MDPSTDPDDCIPEKVLVHWVHHTPIKKAGRCTHRLETTRETEEKYNIYGWSTCMLDCVDLARFTMRHVDPTCGCETYSRIVKVDAV